MIRLLITCVILVLLYVGFSVISQLDSKLVLTVYDYHIETGFFIFVAFYTLFTILIIIIGKVIFLILDLPTSLKDFFSAKKTSNNNYLLMKAMAEYISGEKSKSVATSQKITSHLIKENKLFYTLLLAEAETKVSAKIKYFQELEQSKHYPAFVNKRLAELFYQNNMYETAENHAVRSFNLNESDSETLEVLLNCYAKLALWSKFTFIVSKLNRVDPAKITSIKHNITDYYLLAAKNMLEINQTKDAIYYLESAIKLVPSHINALNLYLPLNSSNWNNKTIEILQTAFLDNPSFEIVELYKKFSFITSAEIYKDLVTLVDPKHYLGLFLAIAAYLDLPEEIKNLKNEPNLLPCYDV